MFFLFCWHVKAVIIMVFDSFVPSQRQLFYGRLSCDHSVLSADIDKAQI
jgi:hypothetical protein